MEALARTGQEDTLSSRSGSTSGTIGSSCNCHHSGSYVVSSGLDDGLSLPMLISSTEMGAYIKWSLLLQEQLQQATERHHQIIEVVERLTDENRMLNQAAESGDLLGIPLALSQADDCSSSTSLVDATNATSSIVSSTPGGSGGSSPTPMVATGSAVGEAAKTASSEDDLLNFLLSTPTISNGLLSTPNLAILTDDLGACGHPCGGGGTVTPGH